MMPNIPSSAKPLPAAKKTHWPLYGCGALAALVLVIVLSVVTGGTPFAVLEDITVFGLSLPQAAKQ